MMKPDPIRLPFAEQIAFFRQKLNLPTERWTDIERSAHDRAFVVAGAMQADLLDDLRLAVDGGIARGETLADFRKNFLAIVEKHGWADFTGDDRATQGRTGGRALAWRTRTIYNTNILASYAAGRWQQLNDPDLLKTRPFWRYVHSDFVSNPRPQHKAWGDAGLTLRHDHPFWKTHFPPNGWGCRCTVKAVAAPKDGDATAPPGGWDTRDAKGRLPGIDQGWDYAPGANTDTSLRTLVQDKLIGYPPAIASALSRDVTRYISTRTDLAEFAREALANRQKREDVWLGFAGDLIGDAVTRDVRDYLILLRADGIRHADREHRFDGGSQRAPTPDDYADAGKWLMDGRVEPADPFVDRYGNRRDRIKVTYETGGERKVSIWEVRHGRRNRALVLVSMWVKSAARTL